ncbi:toll/interleukin-1 receptor domain-containing protein [Sunxiuqinia sp. sy24]|uniref:toll/interleukin-1 receptor domain-containing protein n=1 Tax=Sunxiuqinia sp. sy24 TaxID=3461495 RepID=UPI0040466172
MKIFISHSSQNADYGNYLVDLLISIGVNSGEIIFTSNDAYGIPTGNNIFQWLKERIVEKPYVIYLLSPSYYKSVACLNEMGAAWVVENDHAMIFTPNFNLQSPEFLNGAIDPREIGFFINNESRIISFIDSLREFFNVTQNNALINQKVKHFLTSIANLNDQLNNEIHPVPVSLIEQKDTEQPNKIVEETPKRIIKKNSYNSRFFKDLEKGKLKEEEIILAKYIIDRNRFKLLAGWQLSEEIEKIKVWEDVNELNDKLSSNYESILTRLEVKNLIEVSALTSHGNPKEFELISEFSNELIDSEEMVTELFEKIATDNRKEELPF